MMFVRQGGARLATAGGSGSRRPGAGTAQFDGNSMAAPNVEAEAAALSLRACKEPPHCVFGPRQLPR
jgi:hypothetical protein